ncbi:MAG TPA: MASE1 domain-containing protein [Candidatus Nitrosopolaris sp.]|nr:MASE1 domain-containing protein [Candidatus Nitrosopolaris sp.]
MAREPVRYRLVTRLTLGLALAAVYFGAAKLGLTMAFVAEQVTTVWPPTGIALAAILVLGPAVWPAIALGAFLANVTAHESLVTAVAIATGNTLEVVVGGWFLRRLGFRSSIERLRDVLGLMVFAAGISTMVSATIGVASLCLSDAQPWGAFARLWSDWWIGDAMGALVMAPLLLVWACPSPLGWNRRKGAEIALLSATLVAASLVVFAGWLGLEGYPLHYTVFPFVIWAALRLGQRGTVTVTFIASTVAIWSTVNGSGPFVMESPEGSLVMLQLFMGVVAIAGLLLGAAITERDVAESRRRRDYAQLELSEEGLRLALQAGHMGVWDWDIASGRLRWSENLERIHGLAPGGFAGTFDAFRELIHPEDRTAVDAAIARALEERSGLDIEFRSPAPDGSVRWMAGKGRVLSGPGGSAARMLGVGMDVTERKRLEDELRQRAQQLAAADRRKDEFLAMLAHELRNPLAPMCNALELLQRRSGEADVVEHARDLMERQVRHMVRLVDDLLDVSRITSGKITLRKELVDLDSIVASAVETTRPLFAARRHALVVSLPPEGVWLEADPTRLAEVVANLLENSAKYTEHGGRVWLTAQRRGDELVLEVRDTGMGMSSDVLAHAFDLFAQGERTLDRPESGLGIGLTVVRSLVELHGGHVRAESEGPGRGSVFTITLPAPRVVVPPRSVAAPRSDGASLPTLGGRRVLVVDDNVDTAESSSLLLEIEGYDVRIAHTGPKAIEIARVFAPDIVLLDIGLPGMDGYAVARALRAAPELARCRLIAVSGYGQAEDRHRSREAGFDRHLVKPVEADVLREVLAEAC